MFVCSEVYTSRRCTVCVFRAEKGDKGYANAQESDLARVIGSAREDESGAGEEDAAQVRCHRPEEGARFLA